MQKRIIIPLLILYLLTSLGFHGVSHFCGDELVGVTFYNSNSQDPCQDDACCNIPDPEEECCTELQFALYFESERAFADIVQRNWIKMPAPEVISFSTDFSSDFPLKIWKPDDYDDPGTSTTTPLYIKHQSLIFYG